LLATHLQTSRDESIEALIGRDPGTIGFQESIGVTRMLLARFRDVVGSRRTMFLFLADGGRTTIRTLPVEYRAFSEVGERTVVDILASLPITFLGGIPDAIADAEASGLPLTAADGAHWNELGHRTVASALAQQLRSQLSVAGRVERAR
jgi:hypothetical protein